MNKKFLKWGIIAVVVIVIAFAWIVSYKKYQQKEALKQGYQALPELSFYSIESDTIQPAVLYNDMYSVIVFFNSHCDFCKLELSSFKKHSSEIENIQFAFISSQPVDTLRNLKTKFDFSEMVGVGIYYAEETKIKEAFGTFGVPSMFVYDTDNKLVKQFNGFTRINEILQVIYNDRAKSNPVIKP